MRVFVCVCVPKFGFVQESLVMSGSESKLKDRTSTNQAAMVAVAAACGLGLGTGLYWWNTLKRENPHFTKNELVMAKTHVDLLRKYRTRCHLSAEQLRRLIDDFIDQMNVGLSSEGQMLKMLPSFVEKMPNGDESGEFLAIDLGGTNLRVVKVVLQDHRVKEVIAHEDAIPPELMRGTTKQLFDFIATQIKSFISNYSSSEKKNKNSFPIGFTFSYPMKQTGLKNGELVCWTKGFDIKDTLGKDLVELLQSSMEEQNINGRVFAILNDTVGTLAAAKFKDQDTQLGVILGTGSNAAYIEQTHKIKKLATANGTEKGSRDEDDDDDGSENQMIVNIEWGNFKSKYMPYLEEDRAIDAGTLNKGQQHYEKMISGMYLGEMVRRICLKACKEINLFGGKQNTKLEESWSFPTSLVSKIDGLGTDDLPKIGKLLSEKLNIQESSISESDSRFVAELCALIGRRSATLAAAGIVAIYEHLLVEGQIKAGQRFVVAVDGGLFEHYPNYAERMTETFALLLGPKAKSLELIHSPDGSGIGSAVVAAATSS